MGWFFGVASKEDCVFDLYFGIDLSFTPWNKTWRNGSFR